jgi:nucleotidyltransferase/DNA polymerase involved in DNA repair
MPVQQHRLQDLVSVGPAMLRDFELLGIRSVKHLARQSPARLIKNSAESQGSASISAARTFSPLP